MSRYALFAGDADRPNGGWKDLLGFYQVKHTAIEQGRSLLKSASDDWFQVVDLNTRVIVHSETYGEQKQDG